LAMGESSLKVCLLGGRRVRLPHNVASVWPLTRDAHEPEPSAS
jgi:hypothetical protein